MHWQRLPVSYLHKWHPETSDAGLRCVKVLAVIAVTEQLPAQYPLLEQLLQLLLLERIPAQRHAKAAVTGFWRMQQQSLQQQLCLQQQIPAIAAIEATLATASTSFSSNWCIDDFSHMSYYLLVHSYFGSCNSLE